MIAGLLGTLLLLTLCLIGFGYRRWAIASGGLALALLLAVGCGPVTSLLLYRLQRGYGSSVEQVHWRDRNAIVVLGAGTIEAPDGTLEPRIFALGRLLKGYMLYRDCRAGGHDCKLLLSGGNPQHNRGAEAVVYAAQLHGMGVPSSDLLVESRSNNTWQNAQFSRPLLAAYAPQQVWLVTSAFHLHRALLDFHHFGIEPFPIASDYLRANSTWMPQAWNLALADVAIHEYLGMAQFYMYEAMDWNAPAAPPLNLAPARPPQ